MNKSIHVAITRKIKPGSESEEDYNRRDLHGLEAFFTDPDLIWTAEPEYRLQFVRLKAG